MRTLETLPVSCIIKKVLFLGPISDMQGPELWPGCLRECGTQCNSCSDSSSRCPAGTDSAWSAPAPPHLPKELRTPLSFPGKPQRAPAGLGCGPAAACFLTAHHVSASGCRQSHLPLPQALKSFLFLFGELLHQFLTGAAASRPTALVFKPHTTTTPSLLRALQGPCSS